MTGQTDKPFRCGMVSIVGRPNVGKSTLLNKILGEKVAIVSRVPQTTRNRIRGIYNDERGQIIFIDTPGIHMGKDKLDQAMNKLTSQAIQDVNCIIYLVDTVRRIGEEEESIVRRLKSIKSPIILGLNKVDLKRADIPSYVSFWEQSRKQTVQEMKSFSLIALSGKDGINIDKLLDILFDYMPEGPALYPTDAICDIPQKMAIADIVREKLFKAMKDEIPHSLGVVIEHMKPVRKNTTHIKALIFVERRTQKEIVIGKGGQVLKKAGTLARADLEELLETKVFLELFVKIQSKWRDNNSFLQEELGYGDYAV